MSLTILLITSALAMPAFTPEALVHLHGIKSCGISGCGSNDLFLNGWVAVFQLLLSILAFIPIKLLFVCMEMKLLDLVIAGVSIHS
jgi:hypothetical protein